MLSQYDICLYLSLIRQIVFFGHTKVQKLSQCVCFQLGNLFGHTKVQTLPQLGNSLAISNCRSFPNMYSFSFTICIFFNNAERIHVQLRKLFSYTKKNKRKLHFCVCFHLATCSARLIQMQQKKSGLNLVQTLLCFVPGGMGVTNTKWTLYIQSYTFWLLNK